MDEKTRLIRAGAAPGELSKTVGPPVQRGSTVILPNAEALYDHSEVTYGRQGLATQATLQNALTTLEHAAGVTLYPSGLAAVAGALLAVLKAGDEVLVADTIYQPTRRFCDQVLRRYGVGVRYFDPRQTPESLIEGASPAARLILMESPGSLSFEMQDVARVAELARGRGVLTACDNTWGAGLLYKPLDHGVDLSIQALTKYVGGHSDVFMGAAAARAPALVKALRDGVLHLGWAVSPDDAYVMLRGLRTLSARLEAQGASALRIAAWLREQPEVTALYYPGLAGCPDHELWRRDFTGAASLFSFALRPGPETAVNAFLDALQLFGLGFSWGGFESLAISCDSQLRSRSIARDYGGPLVRLHIGLENPSDLTADLSRALEVYAQARAR
jgi:cystathionine beta-lyase